MIRIIKQCQKEIEALPEEVRNDLAYTLARLEEGHLLTMPLSRPMPVIAKGVHELRLRDKSGAYRIFYALKIKHEIFLLHACKKKTQQTPFHVIELVRKRLKEM